MDVGNTEYILEHLPSALAVFERSVQGKLTMKYVNAYARQLVGDAVDRMKSQDEMMRIIHPEDRLRVEQKVTETASANAGMEETYRLVNAHGETIWVHQVSNAMAQPDGSCVFCALFTDITAQKNAEEKRKTSLTQRYSAYFENRFDPSDMSSILSMMDLQNAVLSSITGMYTVVELANLDDDTYIDIGSIELVKKLMHGVDSTKTVLNMVADYLIDPEFREAARIFMDTDTLPERLRDAKALSMDYNGSVAGWCRGQIIPVSWHEDGRAKEAIFTVQRIQDEKIKVDHLRKLSETDGLTQLLNRTSGESYISKQLAEGQHGMFCLFDVDNFKYFNDHYGHAAGDDILRRISDCMRDTFREKDMLVRAGGDEFIIYAPGILDRESGRNRIETFSQRIEQLSFAQFEDVVSISVGVVFSDSVEEHSFDALFKQADALMYEHKKGKKRT